MYTGNFVILIAILMNMILNLFYAIVYLKVHHTIIVNIDKNISSINYRYYKYILFYYYLDKCI